jgi:hypothetical protein
MSEVYQDKLVKALKKKLRGTMSPTENVLYFPNNLDVRICPKNGMSSLKWALMYSMGETPSQSNQFTLEVGTKGWRIKQISKRGFVDEMPYRKDSTRIAIVRDPVKRFLSACEYMKTEWVNQVATFGEDFCNASEESQLERIGSLSDVDPIPDDLDEVIQMVKEHEIDNSHFYTQAYYMGNRSQYDRIFDMKDFVDCLDYIRVKTKTPKMIDRIHSNKTSGLYYGSAENLTEKQKKDIMAVYTEDYNYGWVESS